MLRYNEDLSTRLYSEYRALRTFVSVSTLPSPIVQTEKAAAAKANESKRRKRVIDRSYAVSSAAIPQQKAQRRLRRGKFVG